ncbi:MAG: flagellar hook-length control protein FliK, partial [bacterium]
RIAVVRNIFSFDPRPQTEITVNGGGITDSIMQARGLKTETVAGRIPQTDYEAVVKDVKDAVIRLASDGRGQARIVLHPPELGELVVRISSAKDGVMRAEFHTFSPLVRDAIEAGLNRLIDALKAEGLTLERAEVFLNMNHGAQDNGTSEGFETTDNSLPDYGYDEPIFGEQSINPMNTELLPEGCTICVYA